MNIGLIGNTGLIGRHIKEFIEITAEFNSTNIQDISGQQFDIVYCAAPSGNRLQVIKDPGADTKSINQLIGILDRSLINKIVLISTCDTQIRPDTIYGHNRLRLEQHVKKFDDYHIVRLSALISYNITKNILYDIKHNVYIDKINPNTVLQWYPLNDLKNDLARIVENGIKESNLCSEPISIQETIDVIAPHINNQIKQHPLGLDYNLNPYSHTKEDIFRYMQEYLK